MGLDIKFNPRQLELVMQQVGERAVKHMSDHMRDTAIRIRDLARDYAPVKTGLLEENIDYAVSATGINRRNVFVVYVDIDAVRKRGEGTLADYAWLMEENLHPYGRGLVNGRELYLGPGSRKKRAGGKKVGGKFLARAIKDGMKDISTMEREAGAQVRRMLSGGRMVPMRNSRPDYGDGDEE
jgi:hypothetical protein